MRSLSLPSQLQPRDPTSSCPGIRCISLRQFGRTHLESVHEDSEAGVPFLHRPGADTCGSDSSSFPVEMQETALRSEVISTVRGAVWKLLTFHVHDWVALLGLAILDAVLNFIQPFYQFVGKSMIGDYMYPLKSNTIPFQAVPVIALIIPLVFIVGYFLYKKDITDLHHAILGLFFAVLSSAVLTDAVKDAVGRPRPDFFWRCFPDGIAVYNNITFKVICHGDSKVIKEGHKSFPSGHTSWSFAGLGFLSLYLAGKLQLFDGRGHTAKLVIVFTPLLGALLVGLSRVDDYWHHWQDVFAGALLGLTMAVLCYHQFFPCIFHVNSMGPYNYLQIGSNFKLVWFPCFPRRHPSADPQENGSVGDVEGGRLVEA